MISAGGSSRSKTRPIWRERIERTAGQQAADRSDPPSKGGGKLLIFPRSGTALEGRAAFSPSSFMPSSIARYARRVSMTIENENPQFIEFHAEGNS
jgi:hypothetical protein